MARTAATRTLANDPLGGTTRRTVLPSGLRILTEAVPTMRSVSVGVWVAVGSRDEARGLGGVSHFLEHLLFKGTQRRSAMDISADIELVGGETNAFTAKEYTCYYARVLDDHLPLAIDVICDLLSNSRMSPADVETERGVILEEIAMYDDEPGEEVHDLFARAVFGDHPLGRPISGTTDTIGPMSRRQIHSYYRRRYTAPNVVVAVAGRLEHREVVRQVRKALAGSRLDGSADPAPRRNPHRAVPVRRQALVQAKDTEQAHLVVGCPAFGRRDERRFALGILNNILGGGMSSRLFQEIREERGLAYATFSYASLFADAGLFAAYAGCAPGKVEEVLSLVRTELARVARHGVTTEELARGKGMLAGSLALAAEDSGARMVRLGKGELLHEQPLTVDDLRRRVEQVSRPEVNDLAAELLGRDMSVAAIGQIDHLPV